MVSPGNTSFLLGRVIQDWLYEYFNGYDVVEVLHSIDLHKLSSLEHHQEIIQQSPFLTAIWNDELRTPAQVYKELLGLCVKDCILKISLHDGEVPESGHIYDADAFMARLGEIESKIEELLLSSPQDKVYLIIPDIFLSTEENSADGLESAVRLFAVCD